MNFSSYSKAETFGCNVPLAEKYTEQSCVLLFRLVYFSAEQMLHRKKNIDFLRQFFHPEQLIRN